jgi:hypothetical protein
MLLPQPKSATGTEDDDDVKTKNRQTLFVANNVDLLEEDESKDTVLSLAKIISL